MNVLLIGLKDNASFADILNDTLGIQINKIYVVDDIETASESIEKFDIDFFFCDLSLQENSVEEFVDSLGAFNITNIRGCYVYDEVVNYNLVVQAINTSLFEGIVQRPVTEDKILEVWNKYTSDRWVKRYDVFKV